MGEASTLAEPTLTQQLITEAQWTVAPVVGQQWEHNIPATFIDAPPIQSMTPVEFATALGAVGPALWAAASQNPGILAWWVNGLTSGAIERNIAMPAMQQLESAGIIPAGTTAQVWPS